MANGYPRMTSNQQPTTSNHQPITNNQPPSTRTILITGCSTGFGRVTTLHLLKRGWRVLATVRKEEDKQSLLKEASEQSSGDRLSVFLCDVTRDDDVKQLSKSVADSVPQLDALLNNAGTSYPMPIEILPLSHLRAQLELNVVAQVAVAQAMMPLIRKAKGTIINVTSVSGKTSYPNLGAYAASKFALEAISDALRVEVAPFGIKVVVVEPGASSTPIWKTAKERAYNEMKQQGIDLGDYKPLVKAVTKMTVAMEKGGFPVEDFAKLVETILSQDNPRARYTLPSSLGWKLWMRQLAPDWVVDRIVRSGLKW
jgi:NAD(P)-dependent dehydrogenase (short-subunit alcohol dehydrogenase family)